MTTLTLTERLAAKRSQAAPAATTVRRRDIGLEEEMLRISFAAEIPHRTARLDGVLSTGEMAVMTRGGNTSAEALANLEAAIAEQGWEIR